MAPEEVDVIVALMCARSGWICSSTTASGPTRSSSDAAAINTWLDGLPGQVKLEPTNRYHLGLAEAAYARGHEVYLIDPYRLSHYRAGLISRRRRTRTGCQLLARFWSGRSASCEHGNP